MRNLLPLVIRAWMLPLIFFAFSVVFKGQSAAIQPFPVSDAVSVATVAGAAGCSLTSLLVDPGGAILREDPEE